MKGAIGLGLLVGIVGSIFLPHVFAALNNEGFKTFALSISMITSNQPAGLAGLFSAGFPEPIPGAGMFGYNPNIIGLFTLPPTNTFLFYYPAMLSWLVCGLLSALFSQSIKKGVLSATVFIIVEVLLYMLMKVIAGKSIGEVILIDGSALTFIGGAIITPVGFSILGGLLGGLISRAAFGPEEI
nr:hypothetical protein [Candidatus Sigynarchaeum springense]MDO8119064.1 hypothetical protein [Candidatus Sigynarchaeota archaeon]